MNFEPTRSIGASSQSNAWYWITAAISAPKPLRDDRLVGDDAAVRLLDRVDERLLVERLERARVDDLDRDAFLLRLGGGRERLVDEPAGRDTVTSSPSR